jgi:hypothetical protein
MFRKRIESLKNYKQFRKIFIRDFVGNSLLKQDRRTGGTNNISTFRYTRPSCVLNQLLGSGGAKIKSRCCRAMFKPIAAALFLVAGPSHAADIRFNEDCTAHLSGQIIEGDALRFKALREAYSCYYLKLRLESPGGLVTEALGIAEQLNNTRTVIDAGHSCFSACALIFMAGRTCSGAPYTCAPTRQMHPTATLGFHAPFLTRNDKQQLVPLDISFSAALQIFNRIHSTFSEISAVINSTGYKSPIIHSDLFIRMFNTPPDAFYKITTNDQFYSFDIGIIDPIPQTSSPTLSREQAVTLCYNLLYTEYRGWNYSNFGFRDYESITSDNFMGSVRDFHVTSRATPWAGPDLSVQVYDVRFENLNLGYSWSGWCRASGQPGSGVLDVALYRQKPRPRDTDPPKIRSQMHYSMAWPARTPVAGLPWQTGTAIVTAGSDPAAIAHAYFDRLAHRQKGTPSDLWVIEKRDAIDRAASGVCGAKLLKFSDFVNEGAIVSARLRARVKSCKTGTAQTYSLRMEFTRNVNGWQIESLSSLD